MGRGGGDVDVVVIRWRIRVERGGESGRRMDKRGNEKESEEEREDVGVHSPKQL